MRGYVARVSLAATLPAGTWLVGASLPANESPRFLVGGSAPMG
jgi:hypothetical protein